MPDPAPRRSSAGWWRSSGAKGGGGGSSTAGSHNYRLVPWPRKLQINATVLVDLDLAFGTAGLDFNEEARCRAWLDALSRARPSGRRCLLDRHAGPAAATACRCSRRPAALERRLRCLGADAYEAVALKMRVRQTTPCVVLDLPHGWHAAWRRSALAGGGRSRGRGRHAGSGLPAQRQEHHRPGQGLPGPTTRRRAWC
jgi:pilus assembly protein CpaE